MQRIQPRLVPMPAGFSGWGLPKCFLSSRREFRAGSIPTGKAARKSIPIPIRRPTWSWRCLGRSTPSALATESLRPTPTPCCHEDSLTLSLMPDVFFHYVEFNNIFTDESEITGFSIFPVDCTRHPPITCRARKSACPYSHHPGSPGPGFPASWITHPGDSLVRRGTRRDDVQPSLRERSTAQCLARSTASHERSDQQVLT